MPLVSFGILTSGYAVWSLYSPTQVLQNYPRMFYFGFGNVFSNITVCSILFFCKMSNQGRKLCIISPTEDHPWLNSKIYLTPRNLLSKYGFMIGRYLRILPILFVFTPMPCVLNWLMMEIGWQEDAYLHWFLRLPLGQVVISAQLSSKIKIVLSYIEDIVDPNSPLSF